MITIVQTLVFENCSWMIKTRGFIVIILANTIAMLNLCKAVFNERVHLV